MRKPINTQRELEKELIAIFKDLDEEAQEIIFLLSDFQNLTTADKEKITKWIKAKGILTDAE